MDCLVGKSTSAEEESKEGHGELIDGLHEFYDPPAADHPTGWTHADLWAHRAAVEIDLHQYFGVDLADECLLTARPWSWLRARIAGLLSIQDSRTLRGLAANEGGDTNGANSR